LFITYLSSDLVVIDELALEVVEGLAVDLVAVEERVERLLYQLVQEVAVLLQLLLQELEQTQLLRVLQGETVHVRVLEHLSALDDFIDGFLQELKLAGRVLFDLVQELDLSLDDWPQPPRMLLGLVVVVVPLEVEHVLVQLVLSCLTLLLILRQLHISLRFKLLIFVAVVVASGFLAMFGPLT
jgi:hypothetical protein